MTYFSLLMTKFPETLNNEKLGMPVLHKFPATGIFVPIRSTMASVCLLRRLAPN